MGVYVVDLSNANIGINTTGTNRNHKPNARCFQNLFARSNNVIIIKIAKTGGNNIRRVRHHGLPAIFNIRYML
ncbi:MAG: hypothetical protein WCG25_04940 [bacterium]